MILSISVIILLFLLDIILLDKIWRYIDKKTISEHEKSIIKTITIILEIFVIIPIIIIIILVITIAQTAIKYM